MRSNGMRAGMTLGLVCMAMSLGGCPSYGPTPQTVASVDLARYVGLWYEIASNPVFFNRGLVGVTAEYALLPDGKVSVFNRGFEGTLDGKEDSIRGTARVVDSATNSKLGVRFKNNGLGSLFEGEYWIVLLDAENYEYAVVTDSRQFTLFILSRTPQMEEARYDEIVAALDAAQIDTSRLKKTLQPAT